MFCGCCGARLSADAQFCNVCGKTVVPVQQFLSYPKDYMAEKKEYSTNDGIAVLGIALIMIVVCIIPIIRFIWFLLEN